MYLVHVLWLEVQPTQGRFCIVGGGEGLTDDQLMEPVWVFLIPVHGSDTRESTVVMMHKLVGKSVRRVSTAVVSFT